MPCGARLGLGSRWGRNGSRARTASSDILDCVCRARRQRRERTTFGSTRRGAEPSRIVALIHRVARTHRNRTIQTMTAAATTTAHRRGRRGVGQLPQRVPRDEPQAAALGGRRQQPALKSAHDSLRRRASAAPHQPQAENKVAREGEKANHGGYSIDRKRRPYEGIQGRRLRGALSPPPLRLSSLSSRLSTTATRPPSPGSLATPSAAAGRTPRSDGDSTAAATADAKPQWVAARAERLRGFTDSTLVFLVAWAWWAIPSAIQARCVRVARARGD